MFVNFTVYALSSSFFAFSPIISPSSFSSISRLSFQRIQMKNCLSNFFLDHSNLPSVEFSYSTFSNFLKTPISVEKYSENKLLYENINKQHCDNNDIFTVIGCVFTNCSIGSDSPEFVRGGAIKYQNGNNVGNITIYGSTFENCETLNGDGGAIFVCKEEHTTSYDSNHTLANYFNSSYCCYSKCSALGPENEQIAGYGPVMFIFADTIEIFYSTAVQCPSEGKSYGAQFDLKSRAIRSSYINSTNGHSKYCCAMEYRNATTGYFKFQTFADLHGGFLTSFTDLLDKLDISYCNYINDEIIDPTNDGAFIYVRNCDVEISNFCFVGITIQDGFDFVHFENEGHTITLIDSYIEDNFKDHLNGVNTKNIHFYPLNSDEKFTNTFKLLGLGPCEGEITPPPTENPPTRHFSSSDEFTKSSVFTKSSEFTQSNQFTKSDIFSNSVEFSATLIVKDRDTNLQGGGGSKGLPTGAIVGIAVAAAAIVAAIIAAVFIIRAKRMKPISEGIDMNETDNESINTANPLYGEGADDPFNEDFNK